MFTGLNIRRIPKHELVLGEKLGEGGFSKVFKATWTRSSLARQSTTLTVAVKSPKHSADTFPPDLLRDLGVMMDFPHQNILALYGICLDASPPQIVCECMDMDLNQALERGISLSL